MNQPTPEQIARLPKWAQEYIADTKRDSLIQAALRWTGPVQRDLPPPTESDKISKGWTFYGSVGSKRVEKACSSCFDHGNGWEKTTSQNTLTMFSTKLKALRGMRHEMELEFANLLATVDAQIEQEQKECK